LRFGDLTHFVTHNHIDRQKWDNCIGNSINALPYAYSWYLDIVTGNKWDAFIADDYAAVFPLPYHRKYLIKSCYQPLFTQQLGLFSTNQELLQQTGHFIGLLKKKYLSYYLHLNTANRIRPAATKRITQQIDLNKPYEAVYASYSSVVKNNLYRYGKGAFEIRYDTDVSDIVDFTRMHVGDKVKGLKQPDYVRLETLLRAIVSNDKGFVVRVSGDRQLLAAAFFIKSNKRLIYLLAASTKAGRKLNCMTALIDDVIKSYIGTDYIFDFEGSMIPGIWKFYRNFGAETVEFDVVKK